MRTGKCGRIRLVGEGAGSGLGLYGSCIMENMERRPPGRASERRSAVFAFLLLILASSGYALGAKETGIQNPSSSELKTSSAGPYGTDPVPSGSWSLTLPPRDASSQAEAAPSGSSDAAGAQIVRRLTVDEAVAAAREGNLGLVSPRLEAEGKRQTNALAWNNFLPSVSVSGTLARWNTEQSTYVYVGAPTYLATYTLPDWSLSASLSAQLTLNFALFEGVKSLRADYEAGLISYAQAETRLERDVRKGFYNLLLMEENMRLMEEQIEAARRRYEQARVNYSSGTAPELTMLQAQVSWANMKPALEEMRIGYLAARDAFVMTLGLPRGSAVEPVGEIKPVYANLDVEALITSGLSARLDIQALVKSLESLEIAEAALKYRLWTPSLVFSWNMDPTFGGDPWKDNLFAADSWSQSSGMFRATLALSLNGFLPFTQEAQQLEALGGQKEGLRAGLAQALRGAETEIEGLVRRLEKSRTSRTALTLNIDLAERAYALSEQAYRAGATDLLDVQNAELELRRARLELLKEDYTYVTGLLDLEYAVGARFGTLGGRK